MEESSGRELVAMASERPSLRTWALGLDRPSLTCRPQTWGVLPTLRFWNRVDTWKQQAPFAAIGLAGALGVTLLAPTIVSVFGPIFGLILLVMLGTFVGSLPLGLFERWLRAEIARRRNAP